MDIFSPKPTNIGCSFEFPVKVGVEVSIVNASAVQILPQFLRVVCIFTRVVPFTIDSSSPGLTGGLNEHPIFFIIIPYSFTSIETQQIRIHRVIFHFPILHGPLVQMSS
jgi:hypothetical protein